jgi:hypothetical protein
MSAEITWITAFLDTTGDAADAVESFWCQVTGYRLAERRGERGEFATLLPDEGDPHLTVQTVGRPVPGGLHLDLHTGDVDALVARAEQLGASSCAADGYVVCRSPSGLTFCAVGHPAESIAPPASWPDGRSKVDQVSIDVPPSRWEEECRFWADLTGWELVAAGSSEYRRLRRPAGLAVQLLLQRLDDEPVHGVAAGHLDLGSDDYLAETERHLALGATEVRRTEHWITLLDPSGRAYCVTRHSVDGPSA